MGIVLQGSAPSRMSYITHNALRRPDFLTRIRAKNPKCVAEINMECVCERETGSMGSCYGDRKSQAFMSFFLNF